MISEEIEIVRFERTERFGSYRYEVWKTGELVAEIEHDFRGDEHCILSPGGRWIETDRLFDGGGPEPLRLNKVGLVELQKILAA